MKPKKLLKCLRERIPIKLREDYFTEQFKDVNIPNKFILHQIESDSVNVWSETNEETYYDFPFEEIKKF